LALHASAKGRIAVDGAACGLVGRLACAFEGGPGVEDDGRTEIEFDLDRPAGALRIDRQAAGNLLT
jgi:hypothetical protein